MKRRSHAASGIDDLASSASNVPQNNVRRRYREPYASETSGSGSAVTNEWEDAETVMRFHLMRTQRFQLHLPGVYVLLSLRVSQLTVKGMEVNRGELTEMKAGKGQREREELAGKSTITGIHNVVMKENMMGMDGRKRSRYEGPRRTPGRSEWDDGRWEWQDTPCRGSRSSVVVVVPVSSRRHCDPSPSPKFLGASPDSRLVSPWLGNNTPHSSGAASLWDSVAPSPIPIRVSGSSVVISKIYKF